MALKRIESVNYFIVRAWVPSPVELFLQHEDDSKDTKIKDPFVDSMTTIIIFVELLRYEKYVHKKLKFKFQFITTYK